MAKSTDSNTRKAEALINNALAGAMAGSKKPAPKAEKAVKPPAETTVKPPPETTTPKAGEKRNR